MSISYWIEGDDLGWHTTWSFDKIESDNDGDTYTPHDTRDEAIRYAKREAKALSVEHDMCVAMRISGPRHPKGKPPKLLDIYGGDQEFVMIW